MTRDEALDKRLLETHAVELAWSHFFAYPWAAGLHAPMLEMAAALLERGAGSELALQLVSHVPEALPWANREGAGCCLPFVVATVLQKESKVHLRDRAGYFGPTAQLAFDLSAAAAADPAWAALFDTEPSWTELIGSELLAQLKSDYSGTLLEEPPTRQPVMPQMPQMPQMGGGGMGGMGNKDIAGLLAQLQAMNSGK